MITFTEEDQESLLHLTYELTRERVSSTFEEFKASLSGFRLIGILRGGLCIGTFAYHPDNILHISIRPAYRKNWAGKWLYKYLDALTIERDLYTTVYRNDLFRADFARRLGFKAVKVLDNIVLLRKDKRNL